MGRRGVGVDRAQGSPRALPLRDCWGGDRADARDQGAPPALTAIEGSAGRGRRPRGDGGGGKSLTWMRTPRLPLQPAPPSSGCASRPAERVRSRPSWASGRPQARPGLWVRLPERRFPAASELGQWVRERLRTGEWDGWLCSLRACLPRAPPGLLERRLLQFLEWLRRHKLPAL